MPFTHDVDELDVDAERKRQLVDARHGGQVEGGDLGVGDADQMRVAHRHGDAFEHLAVDGGGGAGEDLRWPHVDSDLAIDVSPGRHDAPTRGDRLLARLFKTGVDEVPREDAQPIAAGFRDAAVGIAIVHEPGCLRGHRGGVRICARPHHPQDAVGADAAAAIAQGDDEFWREIKRSIEVREQHKVVVGAMTLDERDAVHTLMVRAVSRSGARLTDAQLVPTNHDNITFDELAATAQLCFAVDAYRALGEQHLGVRPSRHHIGQLQELAEPDDAVPRGDLAHGLHPAASPDYSSPYKALIKC